MLRCCAILISFCLVVVLLFVSSSESSPIESRNNQGIDSKIDNDLICNTPECVEDAEYLIENMNRSVDPCHDFYQYTCGGWIENNPIPEGKSSWSVYDILAKQLYILSWDETDLEKMFLYKQYKKFENSCMNERQREQNGLWTLLEFLKSLRGWPMAGVSPNLKTTSLANVIAVMTRLYEIGVLFVFNTFRDPMNHQLHRIYIDQPSLILSRDDLLNHENNPKYMAYRKLIIEVVKEFRIIQNLTLDDAPVETDVDDMLQFERELAAIVNSYENKKDILMNITQLQDLTDSVKKGEINWLNMLNDIYKTAAGYTIENSEMVIVRDKCYLMQLGNLIHKYRNTNTIDNYVHWRIVYALASKTNKKLSDLMIRFGYQIGQLATSDQTLGDTCSDILTGLFKLIVQNLYIGPNNIMTNPLVKMQVKTMIENVKEAFISLLDDAEWLNDDTKTKAKDKANLIIAHIGYPELMTNRIALENYYSYLSNLTTDFFKNYQMASEFHFAEILKKLRKPYDRSVLEIFEDSVSASYHHKRNLIVFPPGALKRPIFKPGQLAALNYGALGYLIGHEILHAFGDTGIQYNGLGILDHNWWTDDALNKYKEKSQCFVDQYANYSIPDGTRLNGHQTKEENIADYGGLRAAFRAYKNYVKDDKRKMLPGLPNLNDEKLFFIGFASQWCANKKLEFKKERIANGVHSLTEFRVLGPLSNNADFARVFNCSVGSRMNPVKKCFLW